MLKYPPEHTMTQDIVFQIELRCLNMCAINDENILMVTHCSF